MVTLATLEQATAKEVFDQVKAHLLSQRQTCKEDNICKYRGGSLKCAAGCLISDEEYSQDLEGNTWYELVEKREVPEKHHTLIKRLQEIHDHTEVYQWEEKLNQLEKEFSL